MPARVLSLLVAVSGICGLIYEVVWIRAIGLHLGTSTPAISLVIATFMAGLALGNAWLGRRADRVERPLALYARIELGIAATGGGVSLLLLDAGSFLDGVTRAAEALGPLAFVARAAVVVALLLVPATLMGGTVPIVARALVRHGETGSVVGGIYAWNTFGAVIGALLPDFVLVPSHGFHAAVLAAALGNVFVAVIALRLARTPPREAPAPVAEMPQSAPVVDAPIAEPARVAALVILSGFCGMALEVLFARTLSHWSASLATSFSVLLAVYLVALAAGSALTRRVADRVSKPVRIAALLLQLAGVVVLVALAWAPEWRELERALWPRAMRRPALWQESLDALLHALYLQGLPCLLIGAAFPFLARAFVRDRTIGASTGLMFTINTLACTVGSLVAGFVWLPSFGELDSYYAAACLLGIAGALALDRPLSKAFAAAFAGLVIAALLVMVLLPVDHMHRTHFGRTGGYVLQVREGATTSAAVSVRHSFGLPYSRELLTPGVSMSDTRFGSRRYMGVMAHAGMLTAKTRKHALLICYGVGNTARSLLSHPELERLDVVDIASEVLDLAPYFSERAHPLADPRVRVFVDDGRHHLIARDQRYDVITTEPPPPNYAGVVNLYSQELYRLAKQRLRPGGVITQWVPVFQLSVADVRAIVAAFIAELPHAVLIQGHGNHFVLVGGAAPLAVDVEQQLAESVLADFQHIGIDLHGLAGAVLLTGAELRRFAAQVAPVTDDRPSLQYPFEALDALPSWAALFGDNPQRAHALLRPNASATARDSVSRAQRSLALILDLTSRASGDALRDELSLGNTMSSALALRPRDEGLLALLNLDDERASLAQRALALPGSDVLLTMPEQAARAGGHSRARAVIHDAATTVARRAFYRGDYEHALAALDRFTPDADGLAVRELLAGIALRALGRAPEAQRRLAAAASLTRGESRRQIERLAAQAAQPLDPERGVFTIGP